MRSVCVSGLGYTSSFFSARCLYIHVDCFLHITFWTDLLMLTPAVNDEFNGHVGGHVEFMSDMYPRYSGTGSDSRVTFRLRNSLQGHYGFRGLEQTYTCHLGIGRWLPLFWH